MSCPPLSFIGPDPIVGILPYPSELFDRRTLAYRSETLLDEDVDRYSTLSDDLCPNVLNTD